MNKEQLIRHYENRIDNLMKRGETINHALIQKAKRKIRKLNREN